MQITLTLKADPDLLSALTKIASALNPTAPINSTPAQPAAPAPATTEVAPVAPAPTASNDPVVTHEDVRAVANELLSKGKGKAVKALLTQAGKKAITDFPQADLPAFLELLKAV